MKTDKHLKSLFFFYVQEFLTHYIPQKTSSVQTIESYRDGLKIFRRYVADVKDIPTNKFTFSMCTFDFVLEYRNWLSDTKNYSVNTINHRLAVIKSYLNYCALEDLELQTLSFIISDIPFLKKEKKILPIIENDDTLRAFLDSPPNTKTGHRDVLILSLLFDTATRVSELVKIKCGDINLVSETPFILIHGKGNKERMVPISDKTVLLINDYLDLYQLDLAKNKNEPFIFATQHGEKHEMTTRNIERIIKKYADKTRLAHPDLPESVYPHMLRRTRATKLYQDGVPIEMVSVNLGHASIETTKEHYAFPSMKQKKAAMESGIPGTLYSEDEEQLWNNEEMAEILGIK